MQILPKNVGILAFLGPYVHHKIILDKLGIFSSYVKNNKDLDSVDALIIPGTEISSLQFALKYLLPEIIERVNDGMPILLTGEASALLSESDKTKISFNFRGLKIKKYSSKTEKRFDKNIQLSFSDTREFLSKFIKSPKILQLPNSFRVLAVADSNREEIVLIENKNILACIFYPELSDDVRIHEYFLTKI